MRGGHQVFESVGVLLDHAAEFRLRRRDLVPVDRGRGAGRTQRARDHLRRGRRDGQRGREQKCRAIPRRDPSFSIPVSCAVLLRFRDATWFDHVRTSHGERVLMPVIATFGRAHAEAPGPATLLIAASRRCPKRLGEVGRGTPAPGFVAQLRRVVRVIRMTGGQPPRARSSLSRSRPVIAGSLKSLTTHAAPARAGASNASADAYARSHRRPPAAAA